MQGFFVVNCKYIVALPRAKYMPFVDLLALFIFSVPLLPYL
jgi:hypothetical protein